MKPCLVIEHFESGRKADIYERFHRKGRMLPEGLNDLNSWLEQDGHRCFPLMETNDPSLFQIWFEHRRDLGTIEVVGPGEKPAAGAAPEPRVGPS